MNTYENVGLSNRGNTGVQAFGLDLDKVVGAIIAPTSKSYAINGYASDIAFLSALKPDTLLAPNLRIYPYLNFVDLEDKTAENTNDTTGYGITYGTIHGKPAITVTLDKRGFRQYQNFAKWEGNRGTSAYLYMQNRMLVGKKNSAGALFGWPCTIIAEKVAFATGSTLTKYKVSFMFNDEDMFTNPDTFGYFKFDAGTVLKDEISGIHDVELTQASVAATTASIYAKIASTLKNMGDDYSTSLAAAGAWIVKNASTGATVTPSGVTYTNGAFVIAGLTTATTYTIQLQTPSVLAGLSPAVGNGQTGGFESNIITVTTA